MGSPSPQKFGRKEFASKPNSLRIFGERGLGGEGKSVLKPEAHGSHSTFSTTITNKNSSRAAPHPPAPSPREFGRSFKSGKIYSSEFTKRGGVHFVANRLRRRLRLLGYNKIQESGLPAVHSQRLVTQTEQF